MSYLPEEFYKHGIAFYNFGWKDHNTTDLSTLVKIVKTVESVMRGGGKIAVHCHAGRGRTALVICAYLMYKRGKTAKEAIKMFKDVRTGSLKQDSQVKTLKEFERFIIEQKTLYFQGKSYFEILKSEKLLGLENKTESRCFQFSMVIFLKLYFKRLNELSVEQDQKTLLQSFYQSEDVSIDKLVSELRVFENITAVFEGISDISVLNRLLLYFLENLPSPFISKEALHSVTFLINKNLIDKKFDHNNFRIGKFVSWDEVGPLFQFRSFFRKINVCAAIEFEFCLFRLSIAFFNIKRKVTSCFSDNKLINTDWNSDLDLMSFKKFIDQFFYQNGRGSILKMNMNIINSPLRKFTKLQQSNNIKTVINSFAESDGDQICRIFKRLDKDEQKEVMEKMRKLHEEEGSELILLKKNENVELNNQDNEYKVLL